MYRGKLWTMRQYAGFGTAEETNGAVSPPARRGPNRLVRRVRPADADGLRLRPIAWAEGEVGRPASPIDSVEDLSAVPRHSARQGLHLDDDQRHGGDSVGDVRHGGREQAVPSPSSRARCKNDILKEYIARGTYIYPPRRRCGSLPTSFRFTFRA